MIHFLQARRKMTAPASLASPIPPPEEMEVDRVSQDHTLFSIETVFSAVFTR